MENRPKLHISIEGMDGVGKSTTSKMLADKLDFILVEKPLHYLFDQNGSMENYLKIRDYVNIQEDRVFTSWFYGLGNVYLYHKFKGQNIITDRHLLSNYCWSGTPESEVVFDTLVQVIGQPDFTFVLQADEQTVRKRLIGRNISDPDLLKINFLPEAYRKMKEFLQKYQMKHEIINTTSLNREEVCELIISKLKSEGLV
ncbi:MAG: deoxynucleoside kinase [Bacteroidales bacterium]|nr:deoxynucleoside kinase [Bacteroidales bacterium]